MGWKPISDLLVWMSDSRIKEIVENLNKPVKDNDKYVRNSTTTQIKKTNLSVQRKDHNLTNNLKFDWFIVKKAD